MLKCAHISGDSLCTYQGLTESYNLMPNLAGAALPPTVATPSHVPFPLSFPDKPLTAEELTGSQRGFPSWDAPCEPSRFLWLSSAPSSPACSWPTSPCAQRPAHQGHGVLVGLDPQLHAMLAPVWTRTQSGHVQCDGNSAKNRASLCRWSGMERAGTGGVVLSSSRCPFTFTGPAQSSPPIHVPERGPCGFWGMSTNRFAFASVLGDDPFPNYISFWDRCVSWFPVLLRTLKPVWEAGSPPRPGPPGEVHVPPMFPERPSFRR